MKDWKGIACLVGISKCGVQLYIDLNKMSKMTETILIASVGRCIANHHQNGIGRSNNISIIFWHSRILAVEGDQILMC